MCPLWPLHIVLIYLLSILPIWFASCAVLKKAADLGVTFAPSEIKTLYMYNTTNIKAVSTSLSQDELNQGFIYAISSDPSVASVSDKEILFKKIPNSTNEIWEGTFNVTGNFLGYTNVKLCLASRSDPVKSCVKESKDLKVTVLRTPRVVDIIFTLSVIILVSIIFINFGCALDVKSLKQAIIRPIGPAIGLISHFLFLPLLSYGIGELLFPNSHTLRLGLFFTGICPAGGASNIWTYALGGNINLSVTMTAVSTLASFALIPLWVFTLGPLIFSGAPMGVPYVKIVTSAVGLLIPLIIGFLIQVYCKRIASIMVRILKPFAASLIIFIIIFATITNFYLFQLFSWQILIAGTALPFLGYLAGFTISSLLKQEPGDRLAIAIETGVQNTGIAIFLLKFCLRQPEADLTTVVPVSVALMTPLPLLVLMIITKLRGCREPQEKILVQMENSYS